ncbi:DNA-binding transcriptional LysR family regulator [Pseudoclavibacter sp. JAI123]|uniref:LysR substrate-binding domain-containing protein n=1 Tax=Pseudoclavibacter sp. JAI123 TaxID=2723065 RepID=UPI0015CDB299|nr:LysR substrate-binding domain-containing protein [Pseudoclavibacter sp. JAI123]NYF12279.1 DNA-binding transcriptional LysR family regulator [Pseudoclavibacter sp. JAI123]
MDLEIRALRSFLALADELHFGRAAAALHVAQPALSQQIKRLETELGVELFARSSRSVSLTAAGVVLRERAISLVAQSERIVDEVTRIGRGEQGRLDVGFVSSALPLGPVERVQRFGARFPRVHIELFEGWTAHLLVKVALGELDLAIVRDPDPVDGVRLTPFRAEGFVAAVPLAHPLATRGSIRASELAGDPFVFFPAEAGALATERNLAPVLAGGRMPTIVQTGSTWTTLLHLVAAGIGVTVAPASTVLSPPPGIAVLGLKDTGAFSELAWASRADDHRPILRAFIDVD